jgi:outer membrane immunogenic protein
MKARFWIAGLLTTALTAGTAAAADLPARMYTKAPPVPIAYNWSGFYGGFNIGGSWGHQDVSFTAGAIALQNSNNLNGVIGGGQIGYNWQAGSPWVFGLEADIQGSGQKADGGFAIPAVAGNLALVIPGTNLTYQDKLDWFGTVRGRVGYAIGDQGRWLPYITGGLAYGHGELNGAGNVGATALAFTSSNTYVGWTIGAGLEWAFADKWSAKLEYLYMDLGSGPTIPLTATSAISAGRMTDNIGRFGINYHF